MKRRSVKRRQPAKRQPRRVAKRIRSKPRAVKTARVEVVASVPPAAVASVDPKAAAAEIVSENLEAAAALYAAAMFEQLRVFDVVDRLVERFSAGSLPLARGPAGEKLYQRWRMQATALTAKDRANLFARLFGGPAASAGVKPNREFDALWLRFLGAVNDAAHRPKAPRTARSGVPESHRQETTWHAAVALACNLSRQAYGSAHFAAADLQRDLEAAFALLRDPQLLVAFGARDMWQVVDRVAGAELGASRNTTRYRTLASTGARIIGWLARHRAALVTARPVPLVQLTVRAAQRPKRPQPLKPGDFSDPELVKAVEDWLAAAASPETAR